MTDHRELLPCPFCGGPATENKRDNGYAEVGCAKCYVWTSSSNSDEHIEVWNRRAVLAQPKAAPTDPIVVKEQLDCKIPGVSASIVITESGMATIRKALAESAASASGIICSKHGVQNGSICPICHPASEEGKP